MKLFRVVYLIIVPIFIPLDLVLFLVSHTNVTCLTCDMEEYFKKDSLTAHLVTYVMSA